MPRKSLEVPVESEVLKWARESMGLSIQEIAERLKKSEDTVVQWESGRGKISLAILEKLTNVYKRPLAVFFLPKPPEEPPLPKDFRSLPREKRVVFSPETRLIIRRARRLQSLAAELAKSLNRKIALKINRANLSNDPEVVASHTRKQLGVEIQTQFGWKDENEAFDEWKKAVEKCGIFVFQPSMSLEEMRGFSLTEGEFPVIVLNFLDSINGKIFSLFHEYAHLMINNGGICNMEDQDHLTNEAKSIEKFCNHFAGAVLVPKDELLNHNLIKSRRYPFEWSDEDLKKLAKSFKVSKEVILRRLAILGRSTIEFYKRKREEWRPKEEQKQKGWGPPNLPKRCIRENGIPFVSLALETLREEKITYSDVADYLAIRLKHIPKIEQLIGGKI